MIAALLLFAASQATTAPLAVAPAPPADWSALPALRYDRRDDLPADLPDFVRGEVAAGRCTVPHDAGTMRVDLAVLVDGGTAVRVVPRAIGCATVEQFAAGLMTRIARNRLMPGAADGWYRATLNFAWRG